MLKLPLFLPLPPVAFDIHRCSASITNGDFSNVTISLTFICQHSIVKNDLFTPIYPFIHLYLMDL